MDMTLRHLLAVRLVRQGRFFLPADQDGLLRIAVVRVRMAFEFFLTAEQCFTIAVARVRMALGFLQAAGQIAVCIVARLVMRVTRSFFQGAEQRFTVAVVRVHMAFRFQAAGQNPLHRITSFRMRVPLRGLLAGGFFHAADQNSFVAFIGMPVRLLSAEGLARHGDRREDQRIRRAEHDHAGQDRQNALPAFLPGMCFDIAAGFFRQCVLHICTSCFSLQARIHEAARPGKRPFRRSDLPQRSLPLCFWNRWRRRGCRPSENTACREPDTEA